MQTLPVSLLQSAPRVRPRIALLASADASFRARLSEILTGLRWQVREAENGAQAWSEAETAVPEAIIVDTWLPDLDLAEFLADFRGRFPQTDLITASGSADKDSPRGPFRQELLYALRRSQDTDPAAWNAAPTLNNFAAPVHASPRPAAPLPAAIAAIASQPAAPPTPALSQPSLPKALPIPMDLVRTCPPSGGESKPIDRLPELIGDAPCMLEVSRRIRLVAQRMTPVLIEGPTGSG